MPRKKVPEVVPPEEQAAGLGTDALPESEPIDEPGSNPPDSAAENAGVMVPAVDGPDLPPGTGTGLEDGCETPGDSPDLPQEVPGASAPADSSSSEAPPDEGPLPPPVSAGDASPSVFPAESLDELLAETEAGSEAASGDTFIAPAEEAPSDASSEPAPSESPTAAKPKRASRRKKAAEPEPPLPDRGSSSAEVPPAVRGNAPAILSIDAKAEIETEEYREDTIWHEIRNAYRTRRILTGTLGGVEQTDDGKSLVIVEYKGFRVVIPAKEMMLRTARRPSGDAYADLMRRQNQILSAMMGAEIDFIVRGIDNKTRSIVASRREAMLKKRQTFYLDTDQNGMYRIYDGRLVQARVTAVAEKVIRIEAFGVECPIMARDLAWDWMGDAHERFSVGDRIVVRILSVQRNSLEDISIRADVKSVSTSTDLDNLSKCRVQGKYAGRVTDVHRGVIFIRLTNGVNAIAHTCLDRRLPGKKDDVSFVVTNIDTERSVALGIITKIIKQNL